MPLDFFCVGASPPPSAPPTTPPYQLVSAAHVHAHQLSHGVFGGGVCHWQAPAQWPVIAPQTSLTTAVSSAHPTQASGRQTRATVRYGLLALPVLHKPHCTAVVLDDRRDDVTPMLVLHLYTTCTTYTTYTRQVQPTVSRPATIRTTLLSSAWSRHAQTGAGHARQPWVGGVGDGYQPGRRGRTPSRRALHRAATPLHPRHATRHLPATLETLYTEASRCANHPRKTCICDAHCPPGRGCQGEWHRTRREGP